MLSEVQRLLVLACQSADPKGALDAALGGAALDADERAWLAAMDADGLRVTSLIVRKLRFERVVLGDPGLGERFDRDPAAFSADFVRYAAEVAPRAVFAGDEAAAFSEWLESRRG